MGSIRIGAGNVNKNRLARFSRRIRGERRERGEGCCREGGVELHHFWEKHIYPMLGASGRIARWACPARRLEAPGARGQGAVISDQWAGRENSL
jgi:hypothetical protein